tara:strand:+ start:1195 stop:1554 length:360 start_codon:yes stop_codon:yes gene_type:complete
MADLSTKIKIYCENNGKTANFGIGGNVTIQDNSDGNGPFISSWNIDGLSQPNESQLNAVESSAKAEDKANNAVLKRIKEYPSLAEFAEAYCEKEIGGDSTKWDAYKTKYNKVRSDNPKS